MRFFIFALLSLLFASTLLAETGSHTETDIIPRTVNFIIFAALTYYMLADKIKAYFTGRSESIAKSFSEVEDKIRASKQALEEAKTKRDEAKRIADEFLLASNKDARHQSEKIIENAKIEATAIKKHVAEDMSLMKRRTITEVVTKSLDEVINKEGFGVEDSELGKILARKVA
jgi:F-type H+-transporting ATPase subunit b